jgi:hypothetical protein
VLNQLQLGASDFTVARQDFVPVAMQGIAKGGTQVGRSGWEDVGGLTETCHTLQEVVISHPYWSSFISSMNIGFCIFPSVSFDYCPVRLLLYSITMRV